MTLVASIAAIVAVGIALMFWQDRRDRALVRQWAEQDGWTLVEVRPARLHEHPDFLSLRITQRPAYRVRVTGGGHGDRQGYVMLGRGFLLTKLKHTRVWWDDKEPTARGFPVIPLGRPPDKPPG